MPSFNPKISPLAYKLEPRAQSINPYANKSAMRPEFPTRGAAQYEDPALSADENETTPVIIVGAGPVGLLLALRLAQSQIRSVVLEKDVALSQAPRAIGYYGPVHHVFSEVGIYDQVAKEGMHSGGYVWRKRPENDDNKVNTLPENGTISSGKDERGTKLGQIIGQNIMSKPNADGQYKIGHYSIQLAQSRLAEILVDEALKTGYVEIRWGHEVTGLVQNQNEVTVTIAATTSGSSTTLRGQYLAGCDGGKSSIRKLLGIHLSGHSWPERFIATDVLRTAPVVADPPVHFVVDRKYWAVVTPLEHVEPGKRGLWRYSMAVPPLPGDDNDKDRAPLTDEQVMDPEYVDSLLLRQLDGPRPSDHVVVRKSLYKMHQLLASTMHRGRCFLAGDAAHINNPIGGLGLCTGLLDADALYQTLEIALSFPHRPLKGSGVSDPITLPQKPSPRCGIEIDSQALFSSYSAERRYIFQNIIHPFSSANKTRLHGADPDATAREDWYFQALARGNAQELEEIHKPLFGGWRTDMWRSCSNWMRKGRDIQANSR